MHWNSLRFLVGAAAACAFRVTAAETPTPPDPAAAIERAAPGLDAWATILTVTERDGALHTTEWHYRDRPNAVDFWPASTIKLYTAVASLELLHERGFPLETTAIFEHGDADGKWVTDSARTMPEMLSEVFRRSSNEDYTLLLRLTGIDRINTQLLTPERGFDHSALMRGYVLDRPWVYRRDEPQRVTLRAPDGRTKTFDHTWSGKSYSAERGATVIDAATGNCTSTRDLAYCLFRSVFYNELPADRRFRMSPEMAGFLRDGGGGLRGLADPPKDGKPHDWAPAADAFPQARIFHKSGSISTYVLDNVAIDDRPQSGHAFVVTVALATGDESIRSNVYRELLGELRRSLPAPANR